MKKSERIVILISFIMGVLLIGLIYHNSPTTQIAFKDPIKMEEYDELAQAAVYLTHNYNLNYVEELKNKGIEVKSSIESNIWKLELNNTSRYIKVTADIPISIDMNVQNNGTIDLKAKIDYEHFQYAISSEVSSKGFYLGMAFVFVAVWTFSGCFFLYAITEIIQGIKGIIKNKKLTKITEVDEEIH